MYSQFLRFRPAFSPLANNTDVTGSVNRRFEYCHRTNNEHLWDTTLVTNGEHAKCSLPESAYRTSAAVSQARNSLLLKEYVVASLLDCEVHVIWLTLVLTNQPCQLAFLPMEVVHRNQLLRPQDI